ncbi:hypothetical protein ACWGNN_14145, partial [Streptomyces sp. NPDC055817]
MVTSIRRRIPRLIGASGLAATLALGAGAATATAAQQAAPKASTAAPNLCGKQPRPNVCPRVNQGNQAIGRTGRVNQGNQAIGNTGGT